MKSATCGHTTYVHFSWLIMLSLLALPLLKTDAISGTRPSNPKQRELQAKIDEQQKILHDLHDQIDQQAKVAESARETAAGAGALGDAASVFIDESAREQKKLDDLQKDLAPRITETERTLAALQAQQTALSVQVGPKSQPVQAAKRRAGATRKRPVAASGASLQTKL